ncbi:MAG: DNA-directed RNA polymerase subunit omega [Clostridia bacterium]
MIVKPSVTELLTKANNRYELVIATSRRARQIAAGDEPMTKVKEESPVTLAANEIAEGKVEIERENEIVEEEETEEITEENEEQN